MTIDLVFSPELRLTDGTVIKDRNAAIEYLRNHRVRVPDAGSVQVLHLLESATTPEELESAAQRFRSWVAHLDRDRQQRRDANGEYRAGYSIASGPGDPKKEEDTD